MSKEIIQPIFFGTASGGKLHLNKPDEFADFLRNIGDGEVMVEVYKQKKRRSDEQNAYYWGVVIKLLSDNTGEFPEDIHEALKWKFLRKSSIKGLESVRSTAKLTKAEFEDYLMKVRTWANMEMQINIPLPNEANFDEYL